MAQNMIDEQKSLQTVSLFANEVRLPNGDYTLMGVRHRVDTGYDKDGRLVLDVVFTDTAGKEEVVPWTWLIYQHTEVDNNHEVVSVHQPGGIIAEMINVVRAVPAQTLNGALVRHPFGACENALNAQFKGIPVRVDRGKPYVYRNRRREERDAQDILITRR